MPRPRSRKPTIIKGTQKPPLKPRNLCKSCGSPCNTRRSWEGILKEKKVLMKRLDECTRALTEQTYRRKLLAGWVKDQAIDGWYRLTGLLVLGSILAFPFMLFLPYS